MGQRGTNREERERNLQAIPKYLSRAKSKFVHLPSALRNQWHLPLPESVNVLPASGMNCQS
jgi:hypothetical protein